MNNIQKTILLVEDEVLISMDETQLLTNEGYNVIQVYSGENAVKTIRESINKIDLILMDIDLGKGIDGTDAAELILKEYNIPIVFVSSHIEKEIVEKTEKITSYGYVVKNSGEVVLLTSIKMAFKLHNANKALYSSEEKYSKAFHLNPDSINITRLEDGVYIAINQGFTDIMGYTPEEVIGKSSTSKDLGIWVNDFERAKLVSELKAHGEVNSFESQFRNKDGSIRYGSMSAKIIEIENEKCILSITRHITKQKMIEEALKESEIKYRNYIENSPQAIFIVDEKGNYTEVNKAACDLLGYPKEELIKLNNLNIVPDDKTDDAAARFSNLKIKGKITSETKLKKKNGEIINVIINAVKNPDGNFMAYCTDITERIIIEDKLIKTNSFNNQVIQNAREGIVVYDNELRYKVWNKFMENLSGRKAEDVINKHPLEIFPYLKETGLIDRLEKILKGEIFDKLDFQYNLPILNRTGWASDASAPLLDEKGNIIGVIGIVQDITERKIMEESLIKSESKHKSMISNISDVIAIIDAQGIIRYKSPNIEKWFGWKPEDLVGKDGWETVHPDDLDRIKGVFFKLLETTYVYKEVEYRYKCKDGSYKMIKLTAVNLINNPDINGLLMNYHDISNERKTEDDLLKALRQKEILYQELQHRVKNNLGVISGLLSLSLKNSNDEHSKNIFKNALTRVQSMALIYNQFYNSSDVNDVELDKYICNLSKYLFETYNLDFKRIKLSINLKKIKIDFSNAVPIGLILNELITNSIKYAFPGEKEGYIRINLDQNCNEIILTVSDDGIGFPENYNWESSDTMGFKLIKMLSEEINAKFSISIKNGAVFELKIKQ
jgi:PAS domain S-box-containing protein